MEPKKEAKAVVVENGNLVFQAISTAFFAWFFRYAIENVPYLTWYDKLLSKLPECLSDPLGKCPYCFAPWLFIIFQILPSDVQFLQVGTQTAYAFGWIYAANNFFDRHL